MYSYEIDELLNDNSYSITPEEYIRIVDSPQIERIKYDAFANSIYIETTDGYNWNIKIK